MLTLQQIVLSLFKLTWKNSKFQLDNVQGLQGFQSSSGRYMEPEKAGRPLSLHTSLKNSKPHTPATPKLLPFLPPQVRGTCRLLGNWYKLPLLLRFSSQLAVSTVNSTLLTLDSVSFPFCRYQRQHLPGQGQETRWPLRAALLNLCIPPSVTHCTTRAASSDQSVF